MTRQTMTQMIATQNRPHKRYKLWIFSRKKQGHKPGPEQLGQPNVKEKEKIIDIPKDHMDV